MSSAQRDNKQKETAALNAPPLSKTYWEYHFYQVGLPRSAAPLGNVSDEPLNYFSRTIFFWAVKLFTSRRYTYTPDGRSFAEKVAL
jgi:hypothetical protein